MSPRLFPIVMIAMQLAAAAVYIGHGDWRRTMYWAAGAIITVAVTF